MIILVCCWCITIAVDLRGPLRGTCIGLGSPIYCGVKWDVKADEEHNYGTKVEGYLNRSYSGLWIDFLESGDVGGYSFDASN